MNVRVLMTALTASTALAVAACGGSTAASNPPDPAHTNAAPAAATSSSASSPAQTIDVCQALPAAEASKITGATFTKVKPSSVEGQVFACEYDGPNAALLQISVDTKVGKLGLDGDVSALKSVGHPPNTVSGVGDEAFSAANPNGNAGSVGASAFASYGAVFGSAYIKIGGTYVTAAQGKQIVELLHSKL
jgi:hypothetical protein